MEPARADVAALVRSHSRHDERAGRELASMLYDQLERLARARMRKERPNHTLDVGDLVNEACRRLIAREHPYDGRSHFLALGAKVLRQVLLDHERARRTQKRDRDREVLILGHEDVAMTDPCEADSLLELIETLSRLYPRQAQVVEMRFFGGMTEADIAAELGCTDRTVRSDWRFARAWLRSKLDPEATPE